MNFNIRPELSEVEESYLSACARIRHISRTRLIQRLIQVICQDQLVFAVLDDDSIQPRICDGEETQSHFYGTRI